MTKARLKLAWYQVIDASVTSVFEQRIFHDSYAEFQLKIQAYSRGHALTRFSSIVAFDGRANSLHYKTSFGVLHHMEALNKQIPGLQDTTGKHNIPFAASEFKILESDTLDQMQHRVAITYITDTFTLLNSFGEYLVLATDEDALESFTVRMQPGLSIVAYQNIPAQEELMLSAV